MKTILVRQILLPIFTIAALFITTTAHADDNLCSKFVGVAHYEGQVTQTTISGPICKVKIALTKYIPEYNCVLSDSYFTSFGVEYPLNNDGSCSVQIQQKVSGCAALAGFGKLISCR